MSQSRKIRGEQNTGQGRANSLNRPDAGFADLPGRSLRPSRPPRPGSSFLARFGQLIVQHGIAAVPSALFQYQGTLALSSQEVWFISAVLARKWTEDLPHPNLSRMEKETGVPERRLRRYKQRLCEAGFLHVYPRYDSSGRQDSNYYDFGPLFDQIEQLIADESPMPNAIRAEHGDEPEDSGIAIVRAASDEAPDHSFVARFGSVIVSRGVAAVPQALFLFEGDLNLTPQQVWFILYILSVPWAPPYPYPSLLKMAVRTGYSKMQLHEIKNSLVAQGLLRLVRRTKVDGGQDSNGYDFGPLFEMLRKRLQGDNGGPDNDSLRVVADAQETEQEATTPVRPARRGQAGANKRAQKAHSTHETTQVVTELTRQAVTGVTGQAVNKLTGMGVDKVTGQEDKEITGETVNRITELVNSPSPTGVSKSLRGRRSRTVHNIETSVIDTKEEKVDSNQRSHIDHFETVPTQSTPRHERFSPYIAAIVTDFSDELGDDGHTVSNVSQALKLYRESTLDESRFADLLFEARKLVRAYQGKQGLGTINNRMAYFFKVLRDLARKAE